MTATEDDGRNHGRGGIKSKVSDKEATMALLASARDREDKKRAEDETRRPKPNPRKRRLDDRDGPKMDASQDYYGPGGPDSGSMKRGPSDGKEGDEDEEIEKEKPNFGVSGALARDTKKGNVYKGVLLKFQEPPEARAPNTHWRLHVFKGDEQIEVLHISRQSAYLIGRNTDICDIPIAHGSSSSQHAVLQYRALPRKDDSSRVVCQPYIMDLESTNGTFLNGVRIDAARYYQLKKGDVLKFGASTREFVLLTANTTRI